MKSANANAASTRSHAPHLHPHSPPQQAHHATTTTSLCSSPSFRPPCPLFLSLGRRRRRLCLPPVLLRLALALPPASVRTPHPFLRRAPYIKRTRAERNCHETRRGRARQNTPRARQKPWAWVARKYAKEKRTGRRDRGEVFCCSAVIHTPDLLIISTFSCILHACRISIIASTRRTPGQSSSR